jgi:hypothetical protein
MLYRFDGKKPVVVIGQGALTKNTEMAKKDALFGPFEVFLRQFDAKIPRNWDAEGRTYQG